MRKNRCHINPCDPVKYNPLQVGVPVRSFTADSAFASALHWSAATRKRLSSCCLLIALCVQLAICDTK